MNMTQGEKVLPVITPVIRCYPHHAGLLSTVITNDFDLYEILPYYIQLVYRRSIGRADFNYGIDILGFIKNYPYVDSCCYDRKTVRQNFGGICNFAKDMIGRNYYVHMLADPFYIPAYSDWYGKSHVVHNVTLYGFDSGQFYAADCFSHGKYAFAGIPFQCLEDSMIGEEVYDWLDGIHCWRPKEKMYLEISLNVGLTKKLLHDYIGSRKTEGLTLLETGRRDRHEKDFIYGINIYDAMVSYIESTTGYFDVRTPYLLVEHKRVLKLLWDELFSIYCLDAEAFPKGELDWLEKKNTAIMYTFMKYNKVNSEETRERLIKSLLEMKAEERRVLQRFYDAIHVKSSFHRHVLGGGGSEEAVIVCNKFGDCWKEAYGHRGYYIVGDRKKLPPDVTMRTHNCVYVSVLRNNADHRGVERAESGERFLAYYLHDKEFNLELQMRKKYTVTLYIVDYDELGRKENIYIQSKSSGRTIARVHAEHFEEGRYISFRADESIVISIRRTAGPNAVLSGIFFD